MKIDFATNLKGLNQLDLDGKAITLSDEECQQIVDKIMASGLLGGDWFHELDNMPTPMSLVVAVNDIKGTDVKEGDIVLCLGEIFNMRGHIAFVKDGKVLWGYHPENFRKAREDEI